MAAHFTDSGVKSKLSSKRKLSAFLAKLVLAESKKTCKLQYVFVTDEFLLQMNIEYLQHDTLTDIITFDLSDNDNEIVGEIYISVPRVQDNAIKFSVGYEQELLRVLVHGALHLCGFKDKSKKDKALMRAAEDRYVAKYTKS